MVGSSSGSGRLPFPVTNRGSNPLPTTKFLQISKLFRNSKYKKHIAG
jgi:hypothetical protein